jgi:hypothetical protein
LEVMKMGRERLERAGYTVLAGYLSPQNATGAAAEMRAAAGSEDEKALSTGFRLKTTKIAVCDDDFVSLSPWEASVVGRVSTPHEVMHELTTYLLQNVPNLRNMPNRLRIFYACGPGQAARRNINKGLSLTDKGIVIVPRENEECFTMEKPCNLFFVSEPAAGEANIVVAARIREAIQAGNAAYVSSVCPAAVARYVLSPTPSEMAASKADFDFLRPQTGKGALSLVDQAATDEAQDKFKAVLRAWAGPAGLIAIEDIARLMEVLDPSWTNSELSSFSSGAAGAVSKAGSIKTDDLVDWLFKGGNK